MGRKLLRIKAYGDRSPVLLSRPASVICTSGGTSGSCAWRAPKKATLIAESSHADLERTLLFNLRSAFVSTLQAKAVLQLAKDDLAYYDHVLEISRDRFRPVISRKSISTAWSCSACSMNRMCKPPR